MYKNNGSCQAPRMIAAHTRGLADPELYLAGMTPGQLRATLDRAVEAVTGSILARADAIRGREGWRIWRAHRADLEKHPVPDRMLAVCMYCERFRAHTGEWVAAPPGLAEMLHDPRQVQVTHGVCPICLAGRLDEPTG
jgi:hypothetical protein